MRHLRLPTLTTAGLLSFALALLGGCDADEQPEAQEPPAATADAEPGNDEGLGEDPATMEDDQLGEDPATMEDDQLGEDPATMEDDQLGEDPATMEDTSGVAVLSMAGQSFFFAPTVCMITDEDVLVSGPGADDDSGEPAFLGVDLVNAGFMQGSMRIELGTDQPFTSTDTWFSMRVGGSDAHELQFDEDAMILSGTVRFTGEMDLGPGELTVDCG